MENQSQIISEASQEFSAYINYGEMEKNAFIKEALTRLKTYWNYCQYIKENWSTISEEDQFTKKNQQNLEECLEKALPLYLDLTNQIKINPSEVYKLLSVQLPKLETDKLFPQRETNYQKREKLLVEFIEKESQFQINCNKLAEESIQESSQKIVTYKKYQQVLKKYKDSKVCKLPDFSIKSINRDIISLKSYKFNLRIQSIKLTQTPRDQQTIKGKCYFRFYGENKEYEINPIKTKDFSSYIINQKIEYQVKNIFPNSNQNYICFELLFDKKKGQNYKGTIENETIKLLENMKGTGQQILQTNCICKHQNISEKNSIELELVFEITNKEILKEKKQIDVIQAMKEYDIIC